MWRRVLRVPFNRVIPDKERNPEIKSQLRKPEVAGTAVFAWAVKGCLTWKKDGLQVPTSVLEDTDAYREEMNPLGAFIEERCKANLEQPKEYWAVSERLWTDYQSFVKDSGEKFPLGRKAFLKALSRLGFKSDVKKIDGKTTSIRRGISLLGHSGAM